MSNIKLYSNDENIASELIQLENNQKTYNRLLDGLVLLGKFGKKSEVELYETIKNDKEAKRKVYCTDLNGDLLMFYSDSTDKKDYLKITKVTYDGEKEYDIALSKKFELTPENIELTRIDKVYGFKFGRFITDEKTFYTLFIGNDISYRIEIEEPSLGIDSNSILESLNSLENMPSLMDFIEVFTKISSERNLEFASIKTEMYQEFKNVGTYVINGSKKSNNNSNVK